ncbi:glycosyltransferase family 2 protein [Leadbetterella byssophila]|nr:glycosyltransferase family 2 protein [Leadbetterella byssophila]
MGPKISIVTICYNSQDYIEDAINSIISQDYNNKEFVIVDGCSTDNTLQIIEKYKNQIDIVISEPDKGISDAFNKGINVSTGDIIGLINSDDLLCEGALKKLAQHYRPGVDVFRGNSIFWNDKSGFQGRDIPTMHFPVVPYKLHICHQSTFIRKDAYKKYGNYLLDFKYMMDLELLRRFSRLGANFEYIDADLAVFRLGGVSQESEGKKWEERKKVILLNGGNNFHVLLFKCYLLFRQGLKKLATLFGEDFRLRFITQKV